MTHRIPGFDTICEDLVLLDMTSPSEVQRLKEAVQNLKPDWEGLPPEIADHLGAFIQQVALLTPEEGLEGLLSIMEDLQRLLDEDILPPESVVSASKTIENKASETTPEPKPQEQPPEVPEPKKPQQESAPPTGQIESSCPVSSVLVDLPDQAQLRDLNQARIHQDADLVGAFIAEANEHLESIDLQMLIWERNPDNRDTINDVFRPFHTIKGISSFLELEDIRDLSHALEDLLAAVRNGVLSYSLPLANIIFKGVDWLRVLVAHLEAVLSGQSPTLPPLPVKTLILRVRSLMGENTEAMQANLEGRQSGREKLVAAAMAALEEQEGAPPPTISSLPELPPSTPEEEPPRPKKESAPKPATFSQAQAEPAPEKPVKTPPPKEQIPNRPTSSITRFMRVDTLKMDSLLDLVGELVISNNIIQGSLLSQQVMDRRLATELSQLRRIVNALQYNALSLRMVPISNTFQKMGRIVRDTAGKLGKQIELQLNGEGTEVDRNIVDELYEPLVHMIRNACDHGIEEPETRKAAGKAPQGNVRLSAGHRDGCIVITLEDDGRGIHAETILNKAIERGLAKAGAKLTQNEIYRLIFAPGFSTASTITEVSGRGVGMDIVTRTLEKLRGKLDIDSTYGKGTRFTLRFPLTLAILEGMIVGIDKEQFIIPTINVRESLRPTREQCVSMLGKGEMVQVRDHLIPLVRIHRYFELNARHINPWEGIVVVVEADGRPYAVLVDELLGKQEIVIKSLGEKFRNLKGIAGGAILGDGRVGLILDIGQLVQIKRPEESKDENEESE